MQGKRKKNRKEQGEQVFFLYSKFESISLMKVTQKSNNKTAL